MQRHHRDRVSLGVVDLSSLPNPIEPPPAVEEVNNQLHEEEALHIASRIRSMGGLENP